MNQTKGKPPPAVILAGGRSERMGFPKLLLTSGGKPVMEKMVAILGKTGWGEVAVVISETRLKGFIRERLPGMKVIINPSPEEGMISSIRLALDWAGRESSGLLAWPVDHPLIEEATLEALRAKASSELVLVPTYNDRRGHPTWWGKSSWSALSSSEADEGAREVLMLPSVQVEEVPVRDAGVIVNVNTPADAALLDLSRFPFEGKD